MKKILSSIIMLAIGVFIAAVAFADVRLFFKGDAVDFNSAEISQLSEPSFIEGEIYFAAGPFATLEIEEKTLGVTTGGRETNFYIVANFTAEEYQRWYSGEGDIDAFYCVLSTDDETVKSRLNALSDEWAAFSSGESETPPSNSVNFSGKLAERLSDSEYFEYYNGFVISLGLSAENIAEFRIIEGETSKAVFVVFIVAALVAAVSFAVLVYRAVQMIKNKKNADFQAY